ncbi:MAG: hypothetical protein ABF497_10910 [Sporolactobacillus sp.]
MMNRLIKCFVGIFVIFLLFIPAVSSNAKTSDATENEQYVNRQVNVWNESKTITDSSLVNNSTATQLSTTNLVEPIFYNNDGNPITNNINIDENPKIHLFGIVDYNVGTVNHRDYFFYDKNKINFNQLKSAVDQQVQLNTSIPNVQSTVLTTSAATSYVRTYHWTFSSDNQKLTSNVELYRRSSSANINGEKGSVWDVEDIAELEGKSFLDFTTRLAVPYSAQKLIDYGPSSSSSATVSVGLSGITPSVGWSFNITGFRIDDSSSMSSKFGRWTAVRNTFSFASTCQVKPGIRGTNTSGDYGVQLSHSTISPEASHDTGVVSIYVPDR